MSQEDELLRQRVRLPLSTAECDEGPIVEHQPGRTTVRYDAEGPNGREWVAIRFGGSIACRFTPDIAVTLYMLHAYSSVGELSPSPWLEEMAREAEEIGMSLPSDLRHFVVYFDHEGCVEVASSDWEVEQEQ